MKKITVKDKLLSIVKNAIERPKLFITGDSFFEIADYLSGIIDGASLVYNKSNWIDIQRWYGENIAFTGNVSWSYHIYYTAKKDEDNAKSMLRDLLVRYVNALAEKVEAFKDEAITT